ncbi:site-2 protease family protein [Christensenellaceae bacterium OttesenSCG-928-L17]|nr:site-2 protease family protein [Christensenellaceae bacterium OttesenSCG-928-L17]
MGRLSGLINDPMGFLMDLLYTLPAIIIGLSMHEWAHAYVAYRLGDPTARNLGRLTINPAKHLDPLGFLSLVIFGIGWAKPVPINPRNFKNYRRDDIFVSLAGVTMNFLLAVVFYLILFAYWVFGGGNYHIEMIIFYVVYINLVLMIFNLIPIPPLDGSHILESLLIRRVGPKPFLFLNQYGRYILLVLVFTGFTSTIISAGADGILSLLSDFYYWIFHGLGLI